MAMIDGGHIIVDGLEGAVVTSPNRSQRDTYARRKVEEQTLTDELEHLATAECTTPDGHRTKLWVNTGLLGDATRSIDRARGRGPVPHRNSLYVERHLPYRRRAASHL